VHLPDPVPIILLYATADVGEEGAACFYDDVYGRDLPLLEALDAPPIVRQ
jgi:murein L,D-transpeptidase YcbB/YkuD